MHLEDIEVSENDIVSVGDALGEIGNTGVSGGEHVHFQAYDEESETIPSVQDNTLYCHIPYGFMTGICKHLERRPCPLSFNINNQGR